MPFDRPSLETLLKRAQADIESRLPDADASLRRTLLGVLASMHAGGLHGLYGYLDFMATQLMPDSAEVEYLERWAGVWGVIRKAASSSSGQASFAGTDGAVIPAGTVLRRSDGLEYATTASAEIADGVAQAQVQAASAGSDWNAAEGTKLAMVSPLAGVQSTAVAGELAGGADAESDASLRARLLARIRQAPHGGADFDYITWALAVPGVTRAWVYPRELGAGTVSVRFMMDGTYADGIPQAEDVATVQAYIEELRPVAVDLWVVAPVPVAINPTIRISPDSPEVKAAVEAELADLVTREAEPGGTVLLSHLREAVSIAAGEYDHVLVSPAADVSHATGEIAVLGDVTWEAL